MRRSFLALLGLGALLAVLTLATLALHVPRLDTEDRITRQNDIVVLMMAAAAVYFLAVRLVLRHSFPKHAFWAVIFIAVALRAVLVVAPPFLSSDVYRYVWDGRVQAAGINPYRYVPADPALAFLRDRRVYPHINRRNYARTIYPPMAELVFAAVGRIRDSVTAMKLAMVGFEFLGVACMLKLLLLAGLPRERILIYAWNPLALWSFAAGGHADALAIGLLGLALLLRARHRDGWAGAVLGAATLVKFLPVVVAPAFVRDGRFWRPALAGAAVIVALYLLYSSAGRHVLGFLPAYGAQEGYDAGNGFWLLEGLSKLVALPGWATPAYLVLAASSLGALALFILRRRNPESAGDVTLLCRDTAMLAACAMVALSPHYPWYFAWLALPAIVAPMRAVLWLSAAPLLLYIAPWPHGEFFWRGLIYLPAAAFLAADLLRRSGRSARFSLAPKGDEECPMRQP